MRALLAAATLAALLAAVPPGAALLPTSPCDDANETTSIDFAWTPACLRIVSGDVITFGSADALPHNARSSQDTMLAIPGVPACFQTPNLTDGRTADVRLVHDSAGVRASLRQPDGTWGPQNDCTLAEELVSQLTAAPEAVIPFECGIHAQMTGTIRVVALG